MSLEDRDIVVIDNVDYKESTSNEGTVIVVEKPRPHHQQQSQPKALDIDLAELLESNWPAAAGDLAAALNSRTVGQYNFSSESTSSNSSSNYQLSSGSASTPATTIIERNRSKNPLSHLGQSKVKRNVNTGTYVTATNLINLDSDGSSSTHELNSKFSNGFTVYVKVNLIHGYRLL